MNISAVQRNDFLYCLISVLSTTVDGDSGVTKVGVTWCGNWWCHPIFFLKSDDFFSPRHHSHPLRLTRDRLSSVLRKSQPQKILTFIRVSPHGWGYPGLPSPPLLYATGWRIKLIRSLPCVVWLGVWVHFGFAEQASWILIVEWHWFIHSLSVALIDNAPVVLANGQSFRRTFTPAACAYGPLRHALSHPFTYLIPPIRTLKCHTKCGNRQKSHINIYK